MGKTHGLRRGTRYMFSRKFKKHGVLHLSTYLQVYKVGNIVDVKADGAIQKGMPHKIYHGKTGKVFNVSKRAVGVILNKRVGNRIIPKRVNIRVEHIKLSKCRDDFLKRVKENGEKRKLHKETGQIYSLKRQIEGPRKGFTFKMKGKQPVLLRPAPYQLLA
ncbi:60S ribosomal protein L21 [Oopsacas minuta]|uniref:Large ribosomal subunit protein eL21 n=1 Tax=Oopsacas minuta TaxID=111878 RepID=A0AAV7JEU8_9METZ|nr:60S ribosomal protein L21 [Oopsacas minuta]